MTYVPIVTLHNLVQANLIRSLLIEEEIPFRINEYRDPGFGSFFRKEPGWGHVAAPPEFHERIVRIFEDMKEGSTL